jgi:hypothetical protein
MTARGNTVRTVVAAAIVVSAFLFLDFFIPVLSWGPRPDFLTFAASGSCIGQLNLVAAWAAIARGNLAVRLPWAFLLTTLIWYALILGNRLHNRYLALEDAMFLGVTLFGGCLAAQAPLWAASRLAGVRLPAFGAPFCRVRCSYAPLWDGACTARCSPPSRSLC